MEIILAPSPVLSQKAKPVEKIDSSVLKAIDGMKKKLSSAKDPIGVGLAAPQIGKSLEIFIVRPSPKIKTLVFINPKIVRSDETRVMNGTKKPITHNPKHKTKLEGCLSLKDIWGTVLRSPTVRLSYLDEQGKKHTRTFKGLLATIAQHEIDHLDGILFTKRVLEQKGKLYESHKDKKGEDVFEEIKM